MIQNKNFVDRLVAIEISASQQKLGNGEVRLTKVNGSRKTKMKE